MNGPVLLDRPLRRYYHWAVVAQNRNPVLLVPLGRRLFDRLAAGVSSCRSLGGWPDARIEHMNTLAARMTARLTGQSAGLPFGEQP